MFAEDLTDRLRRLPLHRRKTVLGGERFAAARRAEEKAVRTVLSRSILMWDAVPRNPWKPRRFSFWGLFLSSQGGMILSTANK
jgi:hypothetical protein